MAPKRKTLSRTVRITSFQTSLRLPSSSRVGVTSTRILGPSGIRHEQNLARERYEQNVLGLGSQSLQVLSDLQGEGMDHADGVAFDNNIHMQQDDPGGPGIAEQVAPLGEDENFALAAHHLLDKSVNARYHRDHRTWRQRIRNLHANWAPRLEKLADCLLRWKYPSYVPSPAQHTNDHATEGYDFDIDVIDLYTLDQSAHISRAASTSAVEALMLHGYLGTSPEQPSMGVSLKTLELFRRLRLRKGSFSVEAFSKVICDLYNIPYRRAYRTAISNSFDAYLEILRIVDGRVDLALGHVGENWRVLNACPPCNYALADEPVIKFSRKWVVDANFSLRRMITPGDRSTGDTRTFDTSSYFLSHEFVNQYDGEVRSHKKVETNDFDDHNDWVDEDAENGDPTDGVEGFVAPCADHWKASAAEERKRTWGIFDEAGVFASACRHGFILWLADMIRCGELAKFPLAMVAKALDVFPPGWILAYDIGCTFGATVSNSSLGQKFRDQGCRCCINAFHGYSHNYACQVKHHPNNIEGMGLEDLETLERVFSGSNVLSSVIRYMSKYHRRQFIDLYFTQWDAEKYANLGTMLYNNYIQALRIIESEEPAFVHAKESLGICDEDLDKWHQEEAEYFATLGQESDLHIHKIAYVELLQELRDLSAKYEKTNVRFLTTTPSDAADKTYASELSRTRKTETERRYVAERRNQILHDVIEMEVKLGIENRWTFASQEYQEILQYMATRKYHKALDKLQKLVIQRLFELHKLNLSQTGYRMRTHIAKSLQTRCKAIRNAVKTYNDAAQSMNPPRPTLDWSRVSHYAFLDEFNLLRDTRQDIQHKRWTDLAVRETMKQYQRLKRSHEEIKECNREVRRLHTHIVDEHHSFKNLLLKLQESSDPSYGAVEDYIRRRRRVNAQLLARIHQIYSLKGFTGNPSPGRRMDMTQSSASVEETVAEAISRPELDDDEVDENLENDELATEVGGVVDYICNLSSVA